MPLLPSATPFSPSATPFTTAQAAAAGWTPGRLAAAVKAGRLQRVHHGVFVAGGIPVTALLRARGLQLVVPGRFHVSHESAADLWGVDCRPPRDPGAPSDHPLRVSARAVRGSGSGPVSTSSRPPCPRVT